MDDEFQLPVSHAGKEYSFPARLLNYGFTIKLEIEIEGNTVLFEPDEERNWRALIPYEQIPVAKRTDAGLLQAIAGAIEEITK